MDDEILIRTELAFARANELVQGLVDLGLLAEVTGQKRNRRSPYGDAGHRGR